ncbi:MAG: carboxymuconolactone decarboxylase family protein [Cytophagaceae bacterium]|jgi:alkyl hydroperoxide reductase subunit D|nr:carboxymuconolactone decarboxylase family protein [Cytophagaceae bacterium]
METVTHSLQEYTDDSVGEAYNIRLLEAAGARQAKDIVLNLQSIFTSEHINPKEAALVAVAIAATVQNLALQKGLENSAFRYEASKEEIAEAVAVASMLSANNVLYRFRHFTQKEKYQQLQARIRMNTMMKPVVGKEFFEILSLAVSAVNGCEMCVQAHEHSLMEMGTSEERVWEAIRIASIVTSAAKLV